MSLIKSYIHNYITFTAEHADLISRYPGLSRIYEEFHINEWKYHYSQPLPDYVAQFRILTIDGLELTDSPMGSCVMYYNVRGTCRVSALVKTTTHYRTYGTNTTYSAVLRMPILSYIEMAKYVGVPLTYTDVIILSEMKGVEKSVLYGGALVLRSSRDESQ